MHMAKVRNKLLHIAIVITIQYRDSDEPAEKGGNKIKGLKGLGT